MKILEMQHQVDDAKNYQSRIINYDGIFDDYYKDLYIGDMGITRYNLPLKNIKRTTNEVICNFCLHPSTSKVLNIDDAPPPVKMVHYARVING